jgi:enamine deaminase RidA (YjgF/YER057c/UK114 family)
MYGRGFYNTLDNLKTILREDGLALLSFVRLNNYITDVNRFFEAYDALVGRLPEPDCRPAPRLSD